MTSMAETHNIAQPFMSKVGVGEMMMFKPAPGATDVAALRPIRFSVAPFEVVPVGSLEVGTISH